MSDPIPTTHPIIGLAPALKVMGQLGYSPQQCLAGTGILLGHLDDHRQTVTLQQELRFYANLRALSGDPVIGLKIGEAYLPQRYGIVGYALLSAASLRHLLVLAEKFGDLSFTWFKLSYTVNGDITRFSFTERVDMDRSVADLLHDRDCAAAFVDFNEALGQRLPLEKVMLPHDGHRYGKAYRDFFQCPVEFGCVGSAIEFNTSILDTPLPHRDAAASDHLRQQCQLLLAQLGKRNPLIDNVRQVLLARPGVFLDISGVAEKLGLSVRTFQRKLGEEQTSFQEILDEIRFQLAKEYLVETQIPLQEIAPLLGFNEPGNFTHAFKRWSGVAPNVFRQGHKSRE